MRVQTRIKLTRVDSSDHEYEGAKNNHLDAELHRKEESVQAKNKECTSNDSHLNYTALDDHVHLLLQ